MENSSAPLLKAAFIDLDAAEANFRITQGLAEMMHMICVVKGNAYGHGAVRLSQLYSELWADMLAVSSIDEALELRRGGIDLPVIILGYTPAEYASVLSEYRLTQCVFSEEYAQALSAFAAAQCCTVLTHLKIDSGMGRLGFRADDSSLDCITGCLKLPNLRYEGIFTHFSSADRGESGREYTAMQAEIFSRTVSALRHLGYDFQYIHLSNSAALIDHPTAAAGANAVRVGIMLYGYHPSELVERRLPLVPVMSLKCAVAQIKSVRCGERIGYGGFAVPRDMRLATLPVGYADGVPRGIKSVYASRGVCPVIGSVCMDQMTVDVSEVEVKCGDAITVFGSAAGQGAEGLSNDAGVLTYSTLSGISKRVPRIYTKGGAECERVNYLNP